MTGYKINWKKSIAFQHIKNEGAEKEMREIAPFTIGTNNIKYLGITLTKEVKDLYDKNFEMWRMKLKKILENGKISHALG